MKQLLFVLLLSACATAPARPVVSAAPVVAAERAFAAEAGRIGWAAAFRAAATADATELAPGIVNAQQSLATIEGNGSTNLAWGPTFAGISQDGGFGFTTGPYWSKARDGVLGQYFTVWKKQADGGWKWIFDGGTDVVGGARVGETDTVTLLAPATYRSRRADADVRALEVQMATGNALPADALATRLAPEARVNRPGAAAAIGAGVGAALVRQASGLSFQPPAQVQAAGSGDMVFTLGEASWRSAGVEQRGFYARIWQKQEGGWLVVFDELVATPAG